MLLFFPSKPPHRLLQVFVPLLTLARLLARSADVRVSETVVDARQEWLLFRTLQRHQTVDLIDDGRKPAQYFVVCGIRYAILELYLFRRLTTFRHVEALLDDLPVLFVLVGALDPTQVPADSAEVKLQVADA